MNGVLMAYSILALANYYGTRHAAFGRAIQLCRDKGIVNLGSGAARYMTRECRRIASDPHVNLNIDKAEDGTVPHYLLWDLERVPYPLGNGQFDVAFASHVLEHINDWRSALCEWERIADHVVIVLPHPWSVGQLKEPDHKRYVGWAWIHQVRSSHPGVEVYC